MKVCTRPCCTRRARPAFGERQVGNLIHRKRYLAQLHLLDPRAAFQYLSPNQGPLYHETSSSRSCRLRTRISKVPGLAIMSGEIEAIWMLIVFLRIFLARSKQIPLTHFPQTLCMVHVTRCLSGEFLLQKSWNDSKHDEITEGSMSFVNEKKLVRVSVDTCQQQV